MKKLTLLGLLFLSVPALSLAQPPPPHEAPTTKCYLQFQLSSWAAIYKHGKGSGTISCDNGQKARVIIKTEGGGATFGKTKITDGRGKFSSVRKLSELYGGYAESEAHAGIAGSASATAMTKGNISLALSGTGKGFDIGIAFGSFRILPAGKK